MKTMLFVFLFIILVASCFKRGLFFDPDFYPFHITVQACWLLWLLAGLVMKKRTEFKSLMIPSLLPLAALLSYPSAVTPQGAWDMILRWMTYAGYFYLLMQAVQGSRLRKRLPLFVQGFGLVLLLAMQVSLSYPFLFEDAIVNNRYAGLFQYPNTFGAVSAALLIYSLAQLANRSNGMKASGAIPLRKDVHLWLHALPGSGYALVLMQTSSTGALLALSGACLALMFALSAAAQLRFIAFGIGIAGSVIPVHFLLGDETVGALAPIGLPVSVVLFALWIWGYDRFTFASAEKDHAYRVPAYLLPAVMSAGLVTGTAFASQKLFSDTALERWLYWRDAAKMLTLHPLFGNGGGSWRVLFPHVQSVPYKTSELHNVWLDWLLNTGIFGAAAAVTVIAAAAVRSFRRFRLAANKGERLASFAALLVFALHGMVDFDGSFGTVWLLIIWLTVPLLLHDHNQPVESALQAEPLPSGISRLLQHGGIMLVAISLCLTLYVSGMMWRSEHASNRLNDEMDAYEAAHTLHKAVTANPFRTERWVQLSKAYVLMYEEDGEQTAKDAAIESIQQALNRQPDNSTVLMEAANIYLRTGDSGYALGLLERAKEKDHFNSSLYEQMMGLKIKLALTSGNDRQNLKEDLSRSVLQDNKMQSDWMRTFEKIIPAPKRELFNARRFIISGETIFDTAAAHMMVGDYRKALKTISGASNIQNNDLKKRLQALAFIAAQRSGTAHAEQPGWIKEDAQVRSYIDQLQPLFP